jgi:peptide chain release factor subunit 1
MAHNDEQAKNIEQWKVKNLIKKLSKQRGNGTSMISLIIPPKDQIARVNKMLSDEYGTASNIKSRVNRLSVLSAITSAQQRLKLYNRVPNNGLVVFVGTVLTDEGKDKKLSIHFEPFKPINTSLYLCDNKFHTEALDELLEDDNTFGFIVMDGNGCLYGTVSGNTRRVLHKFGVELPKKHGRGGQSAVRFARLRKEARHNYVRKCAELATQNFISQDKPTVEGLVLAGSAAFKNDLRNSDLFDGRLKEIVIKVVDVSYGGENGFNQAIELAGEALADVKFVAEKKLLSTYYTEIAKDTGMYCFGVKDTLIALESSALSRLIVFEELEGERLEMRDPSTDENIIKFFTKEQLQDDNNLKTKDGTPYDITDRIDLVEWLATNYTNYGANLDFVTDRSQEGMQFVKGFGGIGGLLRYKLNFDDFIEEDYDNDGDDFWI